MHIQFLKITSSHIPSFIHYLYISCSQIQGKNYFLLPYLAFKEIREQTLREESISMTSPLVIKRQSWGTCPLHELRGDGKTAMAGPTPKTNKPPRPTNLQPPQGWLFPGKTQGHSLRKELLCATGQTSCISSLNLILPGLQGLMAPRPQRCSVPPVSPAKQLQPCPVRKLPALLQTLTALLWTCSNPRSGHRIF